MVKGRTWVSRRTSSSLSDIRRLVSVSWFSRPLCFLRASRAWPFFTRWRHFESTLLSSGYFPELCSVPAFRGVCYTASGLPGWHVARKWSQRSSGVVAAFSSLVLVSHEHWCPEPSAQYLWPSFVRFCQNVFRWEGKSNLCFFILSKSWSPEGRLGFPMLC